MALAGTENAFSYLSESIWAILLSELFGPGVDGLGSRPHPVNQQPTITGEVTPLSVWKTYGAGATVYARSGLFHFPSTGTITDFANYPRC